MKHLLVSLLLVLLCSNLLAQQKHIVIRGETKEGIAQKYNVSLEDLMEFNPLLKQGCHVGMELVIPENKFMSDDEIDAVFTNYGEVYSWYEKANEAYDQQDYSKARRYYTKVLKAWSDDADIYFNRGLCNFQLKKYGQAMDDFNSSLSLSPNGETSDRSRRLIQKAKVLKEEKDAKRAETFGNIAQIVAGTALVVGSAIIASNAMEQQNSYTSSYYPRASYNWGGGASVISMSDLDRLDAQARAEIAYSENFITTTSNFRAAQARMEQQKATNELISKTNDMIADMQWKTDINNPVNKIYYNKVLPELDKSLYLSPESRQAVYSRLYREEYGRNPTSRELALFEENYQGTLTYRAKMSGYMSDDSESGNSSSAVSSSSSSTTNHDYLADYRKLEELVQGHFDGLKAMGGYYTDNGKGFSADVNNPTAATIGIINLAKRSQREMKQVREEARKHGITIPISEWESKPITFHH